LAHGAELTRSVACHQRSLYQFALIQEVRQQWELYHANYDGDVLCPVFRRFGFLLPATARC